MLLKFPWLSSACCLWKDCWLEEGFGKNLGSHTHPKEAQMQDLSIKDGIPGVSVPCMYICICACTSCTSFIFWTQPQQRSQKWCKLHPSLVLDCPTSSPASAPPTFVPDRPSEVSRAGPKKYITAIQTTFLERNHRFRTTSKLLCNCIFL